MKSHFEQMEKVQGAWVEVPSCKCSTLLAMAVLNKCLDFNELHFRLDWFSRSGPSPLWGKWKGLSRSGAAQASVGFSNQTHQNPAL